jgi:hypothetical protein
MTDHYKGAADALGKLAARIPRKLGGRVWISDLHDAAVADGFSVRRPSFDAMLIEMSLRGLVELSRSDMPDLAPEGVDKASEIRYRGTKFHLARF